MNRLKNQLRVISCLMVVFLLVFSYGGLFGSVIHEQKAEAIDRFTVGSVAFYSLPVVAGLGVFYAMNPEKASSIAASTVDAVKAKWQELLAAKGLTDQANTQLTNVYNYYDINLTFNWSLMSGGVLACLYDAIAAVLNNNQTKTDNITSTDSDLQYWLNGHYSIWNQDNEYCLIYCFTNNSGTYYDRPVINNFAYDVTYGNIAYLVSPTPGYAHLTWRLYRFGSNRQIYVHDLTLTGAYPFRFNMYESGYGADMINKAYDLLRGYIDTSPITKYTNYPLINNIDQTTINNIQNGDDITIPTITDINYDNSTNTWSSTNTNITIINRDAEPAPTPTPTPEPSPSPSPTIKPDTDEPSTTDTIDWLKAIFKQLTVINNNILLLMKDVVADLVKLDTDLKTIETDLSGNILSELKNINQSIKDLQSSGIGDGSDQTKTENWLLNFVKALLEFLKAALVPTLSLNLDVLNQMPTGFTTKFPFSLPGDIVGVVSVLNSDPVAPTFAFTAPLSYVGGEDINMDFNLSVFDTAAAVIRTSLLLIAVIALFWKSYNVITGGE